jgi:hypothetical protein
MRTEPVTEDTIAKSRKLAQLRPATGLPELARHLLKFGWQIDRESPAQRIPYFEEAAAIYRGMVANGAEEHLNAAAHAISSLGLQYSLAHADDSALTAQHEAAALARRINLQRGNTNKEIKILMDLAHSLAEAGQFAQAVTAQLEIVDIYRATRSSDSYPLPDNVTWSLLDLAIYLDLAGQTDASMTIEQEALTLQRHMTEADTRRLPGLAIWAAGASLRFGDTGPRQQARGLLAEAITACDQLPAEGTRGNFGFHQAVQAALFARSGTRDERPEAGQAVPIGVNPDQALQPVLGRSFHHWAFSLRQTYRAGLDAINEAIAASADPLPQGPARLAELGALIRRRNIRESVLCSGPRHFLEKITPALRHSVDLERQFLAIDTGQGTRRVIRALTDRAIGHLVTGANVSAGNVLREAHDLYATADNHSN